MDMSQSKAQIDQMIQFILNEAKDKADEIEAKACEEFNIEKLKNIQNAKAKLNQEFEAKKKKCEITAAIARSTAVNSARLKKIALREECVIKLQADVQSKFKSAGAKAKEVMPKLMAEGMLMLLEDKVEIRCLKGDASTVEAAIGQATSIYSSVIKKQTGIDKTVSVTVSKDYLDASVGGGVIVTGHNGLISVDNTFKRRLELCMEEAKPEIKRLLFN